MRFPKACCAVFAVLLMISGCADRQDDEAALRGPYLGQKPPGDTPEIFAPGIVSLGFHELGVSVSSAGDEFMLSMSDRGYRHYALVRIQRTPDGTWQSPGIAAFARDHSVYTHCRSLDGRWLFFTDNRPQPGQADSSGGTRSYRVEKREDGWGEAELLGPPFNGGAREFIQSVSRSGDLYLSRMGPDTGHDIYVSRHSNGLHLDPVLLPGKVNSRFAEVRPFVDPDEDYLIFQSDRDGGCGGNDLWISFREDDGAWAEPVNLGEQINSAANDFGAYVTPDRRFLFFSSYRGLPDEDLGGRSYRELITLYRSPENGYASLYWVSTSFLERMKRTR